MSLRQANLNELILQKESVIVNDVSVCPVRTLKVEENIHYATIYFVYIDQFSKIFSKEIILNFNLDGHHYRHRPVSAVNVTITTTTTVVVVVRREKKKNDFSLHYLHILKFLAISFINIKTFLHKC